MASDPLTSGCDAANWKAALLTVRTQIADYEREGTSTPGKLKRAARLRAARLALRDLPAERAGAVADLKRDLNAIESAERDDNWRRIGDLVQELLATVDGHIGQP